MKRLLLLLVAIGLIVMSFTWRVHAQEVTIQTTSKAKTEQACIGDNTKTTMTTHYGGKVYAIYVTKKGAHFIVQQSKKDSTYYRHYVKIDQ